MTELHALTPAVTLDVANILGESVIWDDRRQTLLWVDIEGRKLYQWQEGCDTTTTELPARIGSIALTTNDSVLLVALEDCVATLCLKKNKLTERCKIDTLGKRIRLNDGRVDMQGRFWVAGIAEKDFPEVSASLYCLDESGSLTDVADGIHIGNGLSFPADGREMFFTDSATQRIQKYRLAADNPEISNPQFFAQTPEGVDPDGACMDSEGYLWSAQWGAGQVVRYDHSGTVNCAVPLPASQPTCVCFAGPDLTWLCVTTARIGLENSELQAQPESGNLFIYKSPYKGVTESRFKLIPSWSEELRNNNNNEE